MKYRITSYKFYTVKNNKLKSRNHYVSGFSAPISKSALRFGADDRI